MDDVTKAAAARALGIDIGGSHVRAGIVTPDGALLASRAARLPGAGDPERLAELVGELAREVAGAAGCAPTACGVALPGFWDRGTGVMQWAVNLPKLEGMQLPQLFQRALGRPVLIDSDVNAAAWAQWHRLKPRTSRLVYLSLGTGVGGSVILEGRLVRHTRGGAGHFGFLVVDTSPDAPAGETGIPGCLSAAAAGSALHPVRPGRPQSAVVGDGPLPDAVLAGAGRALAVAVANLVHIYAPEVVLLGGGVVDHNPEIVHHTWTAFAEYKSKLIPPGLRIERATLSSQEAGVIGAGLLALDESAAATGAE